MVRALVAVSLLVSTTVCFAQNQQNCPSRPGVYALKGSNWVELPSARPGKEKKRTGFPYHGVAIAVYSGASSSIILDKQTSICASGIQPGTTFSLGIAKDKKISREIKVGTYGVFNSTINFNLDTKQAVAIDQGRDSSGNYIITVGKLIPGQYILFMQQGTSLSTIPSAFDFGITE